MFISKDSIRYLARFRYDPYGMESKRVRVSQLFMQTNSAQSMILKKLTNRDTSVGIELNDCVIRKKQNAVANIHEIIRSS